ncbi:unnamed protein product [Nesidiocoris tenuis]|uniref:Uncharacterized protein n=1 Tax=Nesidiocoris tenuis TaxID=355587 RepID=A0A6H5GJU6_9HEMI|nr:unnamed protein product [Nesidiocoris tenuis]
MTTGKVSSRTMPRIRSKRAEKRKFNEGIYQQEENAFSQVGLFLDDLGRPANNKKAQIFIRNMIWLLTTRSRDHNNADAVDKQLRSAKSGQGMYESCGT